VDVTAIAITCPLLHAACATRTRFKDDN